MIDVKYETRWSNDLTQKFIDDFIYVENQVLFGGFFTQEYFDRKFVNNIYGPSLLIIAYADGDPVGTNAFWRNDVDGQLAYQSVDSCVLPKYEGLLIFMEMTDIQNEIIGKNTLEYGFPNHNAGPIAKRRKSNIVNTYRPAIFTLPIIYSREHPYKIPYEYAKWWLMQNEKIQYIKIGSHYYLVKKRKKKFILFIIGEVDKKTALLFRKCKGFYLFLTYWSKYTHFYNKKNSGIFIPTNISDIEYIPTWKVDAL